MCPLAYTGYNMPKSFPLLAYSFLQAPHKNIAEETKLGE